MKKIFPIGYLIDQHQEIILHRINLLHKSLIFLKKKLEQGFKHFFSFNRSISSSSSSRNKDLVRLIPSLNGGPSSRIFKAQFHNALIDMGYRMTDQEFEKLWDRLF